MKRTCSTKTIDGVTISLIQTGPFYGTCLMIDDESGNAIEVRKGEFDTMCRYYDAMIKKMTTPQKESVVA
jgi:hypothetical protein